MMKMTLSVLSLAFLVHAVSLTASFRGKYQIITIILLLAVSYLLVKSFKKGRQCKKIHFHPLLISAVVKKPLKKTTKDMILELEKTQ